MGLFISCVWLSGERVLEREREMRLWFRIGRFLGFGWKKVKGRRDEQFWAGKCNLCLDLCVGFEFLTFRLFCVVISNVNSTWQTCFSL